MDSEARHKSSSNAASHESAERLPARNAQAHEMETAMHKPTLETTENIGQERNLVLRMRAKSSRQVLRQRSRNRRDSPPASGHCKYNTQVTGSTLPLTLQKGLLLPLSDSEVLATMCRWLEETFSDSGSVLSDCFKNVPLHPPVTRHSLSELDIANMINNPKLRHDVNFDFELHFRPNLDGHKGRMKLQNADRYWSALTAEHELYGVLFQNSARPSAGAEGAAWRRMVRLCQKRIPLLFETIKDILKNLVPEQDQARVEEYLDVQMLLQQVEHGVYDLVKLSQWLSHLLKAHCAPMRDGWIDKMAHQIQNGVETASSRTIVAGMRELLAILEAMKLDIANHQIRHLRAPLIEETVYFEVLYHKHRIQNKRMSTKQSRDWYQTAIHALESSMDQQDLTSQHAPMEMFSRALLKLLLADGCGTEDGWLPETLYLDTERLRTLKSDLHEHVYFDICAGIFDHLLKQANYTPPDARAAKDALRASLLAIVADSKHFGSTKAQWISNAGNIAVELVRQTLDLSEAPLTYDAELVSRTESWLLNAMRPEVCGVFAGRAAALEKSISQRVSDIVARHATSSPIELFNALVASNFPPAPPPTPLTGITSIKKVRPPVRRPLSLSDSLDSIARKFAHIAILHWQIWGSCYIEQEEDDGGDKREESPTRSGSEDDASEKGESTGVNGPQSTPRNSNSAPLDGATSSGAMSSAVCGSEGNGLATRECSGDREE